LRARREIRNRKATEYEANREKMGAMGIGTVVSACGVVLPPT
jgi:hypothetical protein